MPIYEYRCDKCNHEMEAIQKMSEPVLVTCPQCSEDSLRKIVSAAAFRLKGSGWYETDFKKGGSKKNVSESESASGDSSSEKKSSDSKSSSDTSSSSGSSGGDSKTSSAGDKKSSSAKSD